MPPTPLERARELFQSIEAPPGAKRRVLAGIETERERRGLHGSRRLVALGVLALAGAATAAELGGVTQFFGSAASESNAPVSAPVRGDHGPPSVASGEASDLSEGGASPLTSSSADSEQVPERVAATLAQPGARSPASSERRHSRQPTKRAGSAALAALPEAKAEAPPSELALQVRDYRRALRWAKRDDERLLRELRAFKARWPESPLRQEAELETISALTRLGRQSDGRRVARRFVEEHPASDKAREIQSALQGGRQ